MKKLAAVIFTLLFASTASAQVITNPSTNARMDGLGVANWQIEDDFNIWINPAQVTNYKNNIYGELGTESTSSPCSVSIPLGVGGCGAISGTGFNDSMNSGSQWGGMNMDVSYGSWGVYIGRPTNGSINGASPLGLSSFNLSGPLGMMNQQAAFGPSGTGSPLGNNRVDLFYGLHSATPIGLYLSYADQYQKNTVGGVTSKDESTEWNLGAGGIFGGGMLDGTVDITVPSSKCSNAAPSCGNTYKSDAGPSFAILVRHHANMGNSKLLTTAQILSIDASTKDSSGTGVKVDDTTLGWRLDTALNSKPNPDTLVVAGIGLAGANREAKVNQGGGKVTLDNLAIPVNIAVEHQTFKVVKTRIGLSKPLYNSSNCKDSTPTGGGCPIFVGGLDKSNTVSDGAATFSLGLGWAVMDNLMIDAVINQDVIFSGTYAISGVPETLSSKLSATYRFK
ncbi:MAG TPA: hypothetical protein VMN77_06955 [Nitrospiria bacterium]|jgi:hypothetical protein|nr:hypothetical protein [Nitrospiria bacterium]